MSALAPISYYTRSDWHGRTGTQEYASAGLRDVFLYVTVFKVSFSGGVSDYDRS